MLLPEERLTLQFLDMLYADFDDGHHAHVKRFAPSIGVLVYKIYQLDPTVYVGYGRQLHWSYRGAHFRGRFRHEDGGKLQLVEIEHRSVLGEICQIRNLRDAMEIDLQAVLEGWLALPAERVA